MFRKTSLKLAGFYLLIIMFISLSFSASIYQVSVRELERGLNHQRDAFALGLRTQFNGPNMQFQKVIIGSPADVLDESRSTIVLNLIFVNLMILAGGGILSYYLARRSLRPIEEAHEAQRRFTADASHELRTPIAAMQTEIEVALMDDKLSLDDAKLQLNSNLEELGHLTSLSEGLLRLARLEDNNLEKAETDLNEITKSAINRVKPRATKKNINIVYKTNKDLLVMADRPSLEEAIITLLDNAVKYSSKNSKVDVRIQKTQKSTILTIVDNGPGIDKEDLPHIFERFYRSDKARCKNKEDGYGLGLAISKKIVDLHNGKISVDSKPGKGTTFTICLPNK
ncbi:MAG: HAMP domain-containing sensor histidine kinase [Candidatus Saccharibacteria bacterium]